MTQQIVIGVLLSAAFHFLLLYSGGTTSGQRSRVQGGTEVDRVRLIPMPIFDEEPEVIESPNPEVTPPDLAPPMQPDAPQFAPPEAFVQKMQPLPTEGVKISNASIIPETRDPGAFKNIPVFDPSMLDQTPVPKFQARPQYPLEMRRTGTTGEVVVEFIVDPNGDVYNAYALRSSQREFEAAAVAAVAKWKFKPGRKSGRDVPTHMQVPIRFSLNEE